MVIKLLKKLKIEKTIVRAKYITGKQGVQKGIGKMEMDGVSPFF